MNRRPRAVLLLSLAAVLAAPLVRAAPPPAVMPPRLPPLREQDRVRQEWLKARLERVLPALMRRHGVAMWIVASREYNEDPAFFSLVSPSVMAARRRTILVFHDRGLEEGVERL
ncbi:MAG TPA: Xaa-Pro aminopeptidase, partial [Vicinamibacteria bacterium]|nr:Xaa-Pro aminopeptidase [Vicinamibacteria bacterium]